MGNAEQWRKLSGQERGRLRRALFALKGDRCTVRLVGVCTGRAEEAHHLGDSRVVSVRDLAHMTPACRACNLAVGDPTKADPTPLQSTTDWGD